MTTRNGKSADTLLEQQTTGYRPPAPIPPTWYGLGGMGNFNLELVREMREDEQVSSCLEYRNAPLHAAEFAVSAPGTVKQFVADTLERFWRKSLEIACTRDPFGFVGCEVLFKEEGGRVQFDNLKYLFQRDVKPVVVGNKLASILVDRVPQGEGQDEKKRQGDRVVLKGSRKDFPAQGIWLVQNATWHPWYGRSVLVPAWWWWRWKTIPDGARESAAKWFYKHAYSGVVVRHPPHMFSDDVSQTPIPAKDYAQQLAEQAKVGANVALPSTTDEHGNPLWAIEQWAKVEGDASGMLEYIDHLDKRIQRALGIPDEVITHEGATGGYSRSQVAALQFYLRAEKDLHYYLEAFTDHILRPLVCLNYGKAAADAIEIKPEPLRPPEQGQPTQAPVPPGVPGQPPQQPEEDEGDPLASLMGGVEMSRDGDEAWLLAAEHCPPGHGRSNPLVINGKSYYGGQFIPNAEMEKARSDPKQKAAVAEVDAYKQKKQSRLRGAGVVSVASLRELLGEQPPLRSAYVASANRAWASLKDHHKGLALHRLREMIAADVARRERGETKTADGHLLTDRLAGYAHILARAEEEGHQPEQPAPEPEPEPEPAAASEPPPTDETPRQSAEKATEAALSDEYAFARESAVPNAGEDLAGSARHIRNAWRSLEQAEKDGTAAEMVTRDKLFKNEPLNLLANVNEGNALASLAAHLAMSTFPGTPDNPKYARSDRQTSPEERRKQFYDAYRLLKGVAEQAAAEESDPFKVLERFNAAVKKEIHRLRGQSGDSHMAASTAPQRFNAVANLLVDTLDRTKTWDSLRFYKKTAVGARLAEFVSMAGQAYGEPGKKFEPTRKGLVAAAESFPDDAHAKIAEHVKDVLEGESFNKTFGAVKKKEGEFNPADLYVKHAERKGGRAIDAKTVEAGTKFMLNSLKMRGLQYGNSVTDEEREHHLQKASEAFADLADVLGLPDDAMSLSGELGIAFGARGKGTAMAHYEPGLKVINLTRKNGVGSLAHEWGHFFDHMLGGGKITSDGSKSEGDYYSEHLSPKRAVKDEQGKWVVHDRSNDPLWQAMEGWRQATKASGFTKRLSSELYRWRREKGLSEGKAKYWNSTREVFARCFERYIQHKLESGGRKNTYLSGVDQHEFWPTDDEVKAMAPAFDRVFEEFRKRGQPVALSWTPEDEAKHPRDHGKFAEKEGEDLPAGVEIRPMPPDSDDPFGLFVAGEKQPRVTGENKEKILAALNRIQRTDGKTGVEGLAAELDAKRGKAASRKQKQRGEKFTIEGQEYSRQELLAEQQKLFARGTHGSKPLPALGDTVRKLAPVSAAQRGSSGVPVMLGKLVKEPDGFYMVEVEKVENGAVRGLKAGDRLPYHPGWRLEEEWEKSNRAPAKPPDSLTALPVGELHTVEGFKVRRTGQDEFRIEKEGGAGVVKGDAATVRAYLDRQKQIAKTYGKALPAALARAEAYSEPSFMDQRGQERDAQAFRALPKNTPVVSLEEATYGRPGRIVKDEHGRNRVKLDGEDGYASNHVEPLDPKRSWRVEQEEESPKPVQRGLFGDFSRGGDDGGRWITIGGREGADGKKHGGSPVYIVKGRITKGHPSLTGKKVKSLGGGEESGERRWHVTPHGESIRKGGFKLKKGAGIGGSVAGQGVSVWKDEKKASDFLKQVQTLEEVRTSPKPLDAAEKATGTPLSATAAIAKQYSKQQKRELSDAERAVVHTQAVLAPYIPATSFFGDGPKRSWEKLAVNIAKGAKSKVSDDSEELYDPEHVSAHADDKEPSHRAELKQSRDYARAKWAKQARKDGIHPDNLHQLAAEMLAHDKAHKDDHHAMLREARKALAEFGGAHKLIHLERFEEGGSIRGMDEVAETIAARYPHLFDEWGGNLDDQLFDLLKKGNPEHLTEDEAYAHALDHLYAEREKYRVKDDEAVPFSTAHAPAGGTDVAGKHFAGGEFVPGGGEEEADAAEVLGDLMALDRKDERQIGRLESTDFIRRLSASPVTTMRMRLSDVRGLDFVDDAGPVDDPDDVPPVIVGEDGELIDGHHRLSGLKKGGNREVNVIVATKDDFKAADEFGGLQGRGSWSEETWIRWMQARAETSADLSLAPDFAAELRAELNEQMAA